jgi:ribosomal-protein-alanine N-acetyltransferase
VIGGNIVRGLGKGFVTSEINFGVKNFNYKENYILIVVALFNKRGLKLYENIGFKTVDKYMQITNGGNRNLLK